MHTYNDCQNIGYSGGENLPVGSNDMVCALQALSVALKGVYLSIDIYIFLFYFILTGTHEIET